MRITATSAGVGAHFAWQHDRPLVWDGLFSLGVVTPIDLPAETVQNVLDGLLAHGAPYSGAMGFR
jgi:hypothetical protein